MEKNKYIKLDKKLDNKLDNKQSRCIIIHPIKTKDVG
tara:strand:+ start:520 stop:630 length:111 start_codon:yes stop_codon:yes gene_type:complete